MKIGPSYGSTPATNGVSSDGKQPAATSRAPSGSSAPISNLSAKLAGADTTSSAGAPFDASRVENIKAAISDGKFQVNTSAVADKLISQVRELLGGGRH